MNLDKARERLDVLSLPGNMYLNNKDVEAIKIGFEAIKQVQFYRSIPNAHVHNLLKGETED